MAQPHVNLSTRVRRKQTTAALYEDGLPSQPARRPARQATRKATYKLPTPLLDQIEELYMELRRVRKGTPPIEKAQIAAAALHLGLADRAELKKVLGV